MIAAIHTSLSGVLASKLRLNVHAHNVANVSTSNFKSSRVLQAERPDHQGVSIVSIQQNPTKGPPEIDLNTPFSSSVKNFIESSNVNLVEETVGQIQAARAFELNLKGIKTADEILGDFLDIKK